MDQGITQLQTHWPWADRLIHSLTKQFGSEMHMCMSHIYIYTIHKMYVHISIYTYTLILLQIIYYLYNLYLHRDVKGGTWPLLPQCPGPRCAQVQWTACACGIPSWPWPGSPRTAVRRSACVSSRATVLRTTCEKWDTSQNGDVKPTVFWVYDSPVFLLCTPVRSSSSSFSSSSSLRSLLTLSYTTVSHPTLSHTTL